MSDRAAVQCDQCGQTDDHPKVHVDNGQTYHHDCLPFRLRQVVIETSEHGKDIIEAAESGIRGDQLVSHIQSLHGES